MSDVEDFVAQVEAAVRHATEKLGVAGLQVSTVTVAIQTTLSRSVDGSIDIKVVELGGATNQESHQTISMEFTPRTVSLFAGDLDEDLTNAIETIERAVIEAQHDFDLSSAVVTLRLGKTKTGKVRVLLGGSVELGQTHEATIKLLPAASR